MKRSDLFKRLAGSVAVLAAPIAGLMPRAAPLEENALGRLAPSVTSNVAWITAEYPILNPQPGNVIMRLVGPTGRTVVMHSRDALGVERAEVEGSVGEMIAHASRNGWIVRIAPTVDNLRADLNMINRGPVFHSGPAQ